MPSVPPPTASAAGTTAACSERWRRTATASVPWPWSLQSSGELPEQALQRVVERADLVQPDRRLPGEPRQPRRQLPRLQRLDHQPTAHRIERDAADGVDAD